MSEEADDIAELLEEAKRMIGRRPATDLTFNNPKKALIIVVNEDEEFDLAYMQSGMKFSDIVVACEMLKAVAMKEILEGSS